MKPDLFSISFDGGILKRGFWLYVWEVTAPNGARLYYVGRTGDSSSTNAQSPFNRMSQHLGFARASNALRRHLEEQTLSWTTPLPGQVVGFTTLVMGYSFSGRTRIGFALKDSDCDSKRLFCQGRQESSYGEITVEIVDKVMTDPVRSARLRKICEDIFRPCHVEFVAPTFKEYYARL